MESRAKLLGHPIHPMLIVFPLGLLATAVAFDPRNDVAVLRVALEGALAGGHLGGERVGLAGHERGDARGVGAQAEGQGRQKVVSRWTLG